MNLEEALQQDILAVLPFGGDFLSVGDVTKRVAPLREAKVRETLNSLHKQGVLELNHGGGGWPSLYGRRAINWGRL